jgi:hypothetical protein
MTKQGVARRSWVVVSAGAAMAFTAGSFFFASSETVLRSSFQTALENRVTTSTHDVASTAATQPISGSEDFWLSAMRDGTAPVTKTIAVGDQISLNLAGVRRNYEVSTVADFSPQMTQIDTSAAPSHLVLVTARDLTDTAARPVRFVMEIQQGNAPVIAGGRNGRTL